MNVIGPNERNLNSLNILIKFFKQLKSISLEFNLSGRSDRITKKTGFRSNILSFAIRIVILFIVSFRSTLLSLS